MNSIEIYESFKSSSNIDDLWNKLCFELREYSVSSIFYAMGYAPKHARNEGLFDGAWFKGNHPEEFRQYFDSKFKIEDDPTSMHCLGDETEPYVWHRPPHPSKQTEAQNEFMRKSYEFGMGIGVSLPIRFNHFGVCGVGLCMRGLDENEFDDLWEKHQVSITNICHSFDEILRSQFMLEIYPLTPPEIDALAGLVEGKNIQNIASDLGKSPSTLEKQIRSARTKLGTANDKQASVKAVILGIISLE